MNNKIVAVVVTYNRKKLLRQCIEHILGQSVSKVDVFIIDNFSTDGTQEMIQDFYKENDRIFYYNTGTNLGGAGGFSYGIRKAVEANYQYLWLMDDDTFPDKDALQSFFNADMILQGEYGFLVGYAKWTDGSSCEMNIPGISLNWRNNISMQFENHLIQVESASFVSCFLKASVVEEVGLPIKEFFIWSDDQEYTKRISKRYPCYFVYDSQVIHAMRSNQATSIVEESEERLERYELLYRNRYYIAKHGAVRDRFLYWLLIKNTIRDILHSDCSLKRKKVGIVLKSCWKGLFFNPIIEYVDK